MCEVTDISQCGLHTASTKQDPRNPFLSPCAAGGRIHAQDSCYDHISGYSEKCINVGKKESL